MLFPLRPMLAMSPALIVPFCVLFVLAVVLVWRGKVPLSYNVRNLTVRWKTTVLTALAFTLVISLLTVMLAFVNGMRRLTEGSGNPENVIVLSEGVTDEVTSNLGFSDVGDIENQRGVRREEGRPLCSRETYMVVNQPIPDAPEGQRKRRFLQVRGLDDAPMSARVHGLELRAGQWFSAAGVRKTSSSAEGATAAQDVIEVVVGEGLAGELARSRSDQSRAKAADPLRLDVGDTFTLGDRTAVIAGVMQTGGTTFDSEVWAKRAIVGPMFGKETYTSLVLRADNSDAAKTLASFLSNDFTKASVDAQVETEYFASLSQTNEQFLVAIGFVTIVMAVGGVFGVMNTMYAAISQRTKDIGVLRIVGFARWQVLVSFLAESLVIALVGGLLGMALGSLVDGWTATSVVSGSGGGGKSVVLRLAVDANTLITGLLLTIGMGAIGGLVPALSAMRLRPLEALR